MALALLIIDGPHVRFEFETYWIILPVINRVFMGEVSEVHRARSLKKRRRGATASLALL